MWAIATQINIYMIFCVCACVYVRVYTQQCNSSSCLFLSFCSLLPFFLLLSDFLFLWLYISTHCLPRIYCCLFFVMLKWLSGVCVCPSRIKHSYTSSFSHTSWTGIFPSSSVHWFGVAVSLATRHPFVVLQIHRNSFLFLETRMTKISSVQQHTIRTMWVDHMLEEGPSLTGFPLGVVDTSLVVVVPLPASGVVIFSQSRHGSLLQWYPRSQPHSALWVAVQFLLYSKRIMLQSLHLWQARASS